MRMPAKVRTIYLDNSHLHLLSELKRIHASRFTSFLQTWTKEHCVLALSQTHLMEINRYQDQRKREARYELLETLMPIHSDVPIGESGSSLLRSLTNREILAAFVNRGVVSFEDPTMAPLTTGFPNTLTSRHHIDLLKE